MKKSFNPKALFTSSLGSVARNAGWLTGLQLGQRLLGLVTTYFIVRVLSQSAYGEYNFIFSIVGVTAVFGLPGISNAVTQSVARGYKGTFRASIRPAFLSSFGGSAVLTGLAVWYYHAGKQDLGASCIIAAALFPFSLGLLQWKGFRAGTEDFAGLVKREGVASIATSVLLLLSVLYLSDSFVPLVFVVYMMPALLNLVMTRVTWKEPGCVQPPEEGIIRYGVVTSVYSVLGIVANHVEKLVVFFFMTPASLAIFVAASKFPDLTKAFIKNIATALAPRFARHTSYTRRVDRAFGIFAVASAAVIIAVAFTVLPWIVLFIFGEDYRESVPYAQALMCSLAIVSTVPLRSRFVLSRQDTDSFRDFNAAMAIFRIVGSVVLIPLLGLKGAVISVVISRVGSAITMHFIMKKRYPIDSGDV